MRMYKINNRPIRKVRNRHVSEIKTR